MRPRQTYPFVIFIAECTGHYMAFNFWVMENRHNIVANQMLILHLGASLVRFQFTIFQCENFNVFPKRLTTNNYCHCRPTVRQHHLKHSFHSFDLHVTVAQPPCSWTSMHTLSVPVPAIQLVYTTTTLPHAQLSDSASHFCLRTDKALLQYGDYQQRLGWKLGHLERRITCRGVG